MEKIDLIKGLAARFGAFPERFAPVREQAGKAWGFLISNPAADLIAPPTVTVLSLEPGTVVILSARRSFSDYKLLAARSYAVEGRDYPTPDEAASIFEIARTELNIGAGDLILCLPKSWVIIQSAELPAAAADDLPQVVAYELDRFMPFEAEEAVFDYIVEERTSEKIRLSLAACREAIVAGYIAAFARAGVSVGRVSVDCSALGTATRFFARRDSFLFAHVGNASVSGGRVEDGVLKSVFSRVPHDQGQYPEALNALLSVLEPEKTELPLLLLFGEGTAVSREQLERRHVSFEAVHDTGGVFAGSPLFGSAGYPAVGAALEVLWPNANGLNLLARGVRLPVRPPLRVTMALLSAILVCLVIYMLMPLQIEEKRLKEIDRQIALRKNQVAEVESVIKEINDLTKEQAMVSSFKQARRRSIDVLRELTTVIPKNAWLSRVRIAGSQVNLEGYSPSASGLIEVLEASAFFQKVEFSSPTFRDARQNMDRFQIKMELETALPEGKSGEKL